MDKKKTEDEPNEKTTDTGNEMFSKGVDLNVYTIKKDDDKPTWDREVPKPLPGSKGECFVFTLVGPRSSGKSVVINNLVLRDEMLRNVFKDIVNNSNYQVYQLVGAYGDAIYHPQILEIVEFLLKTDKKFFIETNGAHKKKEFWDKWIQLPWRRQALMVWSIDGLEDTNHLYRRNSNWESIMYGVKTILDMPRNKRPGMKWKYLVFP